MSKKKVYTDINRQWKDFRLDDMADKPVNEVIDKRALAWLSDSIIVALIGNHKTGIAQLSKRQDIVRKYVNANNFQEAYNILHEELGMALRRAAIKLENLGD